MSRTLFIDLGSHSTVPQEGACLACVSENKTEAIRFIDHRISDDSLMPELDAVLKEAGWELKDITQIACVAGPGGFTSLRMAVTLANVVADQLDIPLAGIHLSDLYAKRVETPHGASLQRGFLWIHATKKDQLFVRGFGEYKKIWPEATLVSLDDLVKNYPQDAPYAGEILEPQREVLKAESLSLNSIADTLPALLSSLSYQKGTIEPWYGRGW
jgi:tRNA threonylcarbamoyl adenosine modification protein YeaZ